MNALLGESHQAFRVLRSHHIATLDLTVTEYVHEPTGAMHFHLGADNDECVFSVAFRTVPMDSTGVAHVLEHTVLCGSEKYPVRDPFFWMIRRSLNTFMNAFTTSDYTAYPFASQIRKDFFNLLDVYLDATFHSNLHPLDFAQEGHRLEFREPENPDSPLEHRGVVYNEMKGDASSVIATLYEQLCKHLYPTTTYHYNSGGNPANIPDLTYEQLQAFYKSHYHPSNAIFMTFGNVDIAAVQERIYRSALADVSAANVHIEVGEELRLTEPVAVSEPYPLEPGQSKARKSHVVIGWLLGQNTDLEHVLKASLMADVLLDTSASPLRRALEATPLADGVSPVSGLEDSSREISFACGVEGSDPEHADAIEALIMQTLLDVAENGVPASKLEACLHQLELHQREVGGDGAPFGLQLMFATMPAAVHGGDPVGLLDLEPVLVRLREDIQDPAFMPRLVRELLLDNPHRVRLTLYPDTGLAAREAGKDRQSLDTLAAGMSAEAKQALVDQARALRERQGMVEDIEVLPKVGLEDIPAHTARPEGTRHVAGDLPVTLFEAGTNGLVYAQLVSPLPALDPEALKLLPYLTNLLSEIGSGNEGYLATQHSQHAETGGISTWSSVRGTIDDPDEVIAWFTVSSRTLNHKRGAMLELLRRTIDSPDFNEPDRLRELMKQLQTRRERNVTGSGHALAMTAAGAAWRPVPWLNHHLTGLEAIAGLGDMVSTLDTPEGLQSFAENLGSVHNQIAQQSRQGLIINDATELPGSLEDMARILGGQQAHGEQQVFHPGRHRAGVPERQCWTTNTQVNFCAMVCPTVPESHPDSPVLSVLGSVLTNAQLHRALREEGGAYGGGASHDSANGLFRFYSYRDPNLLSTFEAFEQSRQWIMTSAPSRALVEEAILGIVGAMDAPASPAGQARQAFYQSLFGRTQSHRDTMRSRLLAVTPEDVQRVAQTWLDRDWSRAVVTNREGARQLPPEWTVRNLHLEVTTEGE